MRLVLIWVTRHIDDIFNISLPPRRALSLRRDIAIAFCAPPRDATRRRRSLPLVLRRDTSLLFVARVFVIYDVPLCVIFVCVFLAFTYVLTDAGFSPLILLFPLALRLAHNKSPPLLRRTPHMMLLLPLYLVTPLLGCSTTSPFPFALRPGMHMASMPLALRFGLPRIVPHPGTQRLHLG